MAEEKNSLNSLSDKLGYDGQGVKGPSDAEILSQCFYGI